MARINSNNFERIEKQRNNVHEEVGSTFTVFEEKGEIHVW